MPLREYRSTEVDYFCSPEIAEDFALLRPADFRLQIALTLEDLLDTPRVSLLNSFVRRSGLSRLAILEAHGDDDRGRWVYVSDGKPITVQSWVKRMDGRYAALVLRCCNPRAREIRSRRSLVFAPNNTFSLSSVQEGMVQIEAYLPGHGYVDSYEFEGVLADLRKAS